VSASALLEDHATRFPPDHRRAERARVRLPLWVWPQHGEFDHVIAESEDISALGIRVVLDCPLAEGAEVALSLPTRACPAEIGLPPALEGKAIARRVSRISATHCTAVLVLHEALAQSMEMALYMACLLGREGGHAALGSIT
jgi:hypothetical protein